MRKYLVYLLTVIALLQATEAQTVYHLPFASSGNMIELAVANGSPVAATSVKVSLQNAPAWVQFVQSEQTISSVAAGEEQLVTFTFSVDKSAPVGQEQTIRFFISNARGESWSKEIRVSVATPKTFELFQNYPNPFNPTTTINYQLPTPMRVTLKIFNLLGQEVATLIDGEKPAGFHQETFDARTLASGVYVYQLVGHETTGRQVVSRKAMVLIK
ncbi:MAG TPA: T9SS type A sorting domain-containing protein [Bacteroidota bacterium]